VFSLGAILNDGFVFFSSQYNTKIEVFSLGAILNDGGFFSPVSTILK